MLFRSEPTEAAEATDTAPVNDIKFADETVEADEPTPDARPSQRSSRRAHRTGDTPDAADRTPGPAAAQPSAPSSE